MRWRVGAMTVLTSLALAGTASGDVPVQTITLVNHIGNSRYGGWPIKDVERALIVQAQQLRHYWGTPLIRFGAGGWPVFLERRTGKAFHSDFGGQPFVRLDVVATGESQGWWWTGALSHEVMEMLVNPRPDASVFGEFGEQKEICDPTGGSRYELGIKGETIWSPRLAAHPYLVVPLEDFVTPAWFQGGAGPYDYMRMIGRPDEWLSQLF